MMPLFSVFPTVGLNFVLIAFVIVVLGGMGSIEGALLGGICIGIVQSLSSYYIAPAFGQMFFFMLFLLVMIFRPAGLLGRKGEADHRHQRLNPDGRGGAKSQATRRPVAAAAGARHGLAVRAGLLAVCVALVAVRLPQYLQDVVIQTFLWAGLALAWNIAGGYAGLISFGHAAFFGVGAYTSSDPGGELRPDAVDRTVDRRAAGGGLRRGAHARVRAAARAVLHPVHARGRRGGQDRGAQLGIVDRRSGGALDPADRQHRQHGVRVEGHLRRADAGILRSDLRHHQGGRRLALRLLPVRRAR